MYKNKIGLRPIIFALLLFSFQFSAAFANGAKPMQDPAGNGGLVFDENPGVALVNETITFDITDPTYVPRAKVIVEYEMKNLLDQDQSFDMFFVIPPFHSSETAAPYKVSLDGKDISQLSFSKNMEAPNNWQPKFPQGLVEPYSQEVYDTNLVDDTGMGYRVHPNELTGINIPISIKANSTTKLLIEYSCVGGFNNRPQYLNMIHNFMYYLTPAKYWNHEPQVTLNVSLPDNHKYTLHSSIPLEMISPNSYTAKLDGLPDTEWVFSFVDRQGLIYGTNSSKNHAQITLCISAALLVGAFTLSKKLKNRAYAILGYLLAVAYFYLFKGKLVDGYIGEFLVMVPISLVLILIVPIAYYAHIKRVKKDLRIVVEKDSNIQE